MRDWLIQIRKGKKLSQKEVAKEVGISQQLYSCIETGLRGNPVKISTAKKIAGLLKFDYLMFYEDDQSTRM